MTNIGTDAVEQVRVKAQPLTREGVKPYGDILDAGDVAHINRSVWHGSLVLNEACTFVNITRKDPGEGTTNSVEVDDENIKHTREYIELVNIRRRDGRQIVLELRCLLASR